MSSEFNFTEIHNALTRRFNLDELRTLCAKLGVPYEEVGSSGTLTGNARELIYWLDRRGRLRELEPSISGVRVLVRNQATLNPNLQQAGVNSHATLEPAGEPIRKSQRKGRGRGARTATGSTQAARPKERVPERSSLAMTGRTKLLAASLLGLLLLSFFIWAFIYAPDHLPAYKQRILAIVSALLCGLFTFFLTGAITVRTEAPQTPLGLSLKSTGGVAVFTLVILWWLTPFAPVAAVEDARADTPPASGESHKELTAVPLAPLAISGRVNSITLDAAGERAAVAGEDGAVRVWHPGAQSSFRELARGGKRSGARSVALAAGGETVAAGYGNGDGKICLWRKGRATSPEEVQSHSWSVYEVYLSRDGKRLVTTGEDAGEVRSARSWKVGDKIELVKTFKTPSPDDEILAVSPDLQVVAFYSLQRRSVKLWSILEEKLLASLESSDLDVRGGGAFSEDGKLFAVGSMGGTVVLWRVPDGKRMREFKGPGREVVSVALHPTGRMAAAGYPDGTVCLWDTTENLFTSMKEDEAEVHALAFSASGRMLASGGGGGKIQLWEVGVKP